MELAEKMNNELEPVRARREELVANPGMISEILRAGAVKAEGIARETLKEVREVMNLPTRESLDV